jgi:diguanylate cyclase (GGDEF)-like protein
MSRAQMLLLALVLMHLLLGVMCLAVSRGERESKALRLWGIGLLVYSIGAFLTVLSGILPLGLRQVIGNSIVSFSAIITTSGVLAYSHTQLARRIVLPAWAAVVIMLTANHLTGPYYVVDVGAPTVFASILYLFAAFTILRTHRIGARNALRFVAASMFVVVAVWNTRFIAVWMSAGSAADRSAADLPLSIFAIAQLLLVVAATLGLLWTEVRIVDTDLKHAALSDWLTGLHNRRAMHARFMEGLSRAQRHNESFALVTFDIDHFKRINDRYGHLAGDSLLREIAATLRDAKRTEDQLGRHGGEEFLLLLPNQDRSEAMRIADRLREQVANMVVDYGGHELQVTMSAGVSAFPEDGSNWDQLFGAADRRLYLAKQAGRNRVVVEG